MIRLKDPGKRGDEITVTMYAGDLVSLIECCRRAAIHSKHRAEEYGQTLRDRGQQDDPVLADLLDAVVQHMKDAEANVRELEKVMNDREAVLTS